MPTEAEIDVQARIVWDYHLMNQALVRSDCILVLGSNDPRVATHGARLYLEQWAPRLVFSGGVGKLTEGLYGTTEAEHFAQLAVDLGVPKADILVESEATNTGENIRFARRLLAEHGLDPQRLILVQKPFMERRTYATFARQWPGKAFVVSSPPIPFADYPTAGLPKADVLNVMVGDLQRIRVYPKLGFHIPQPIPDDVWAAYEQLVAWGFDRHLIPDGELPAT